MGRWRDNDCMGLQEGSNNRNISRRDRFRVIEIIRTGRIKDSISVHDVPWLTIVLHVYSKIVKMTRRPMTLGAYLARAIDISLEEAHRIVVLYPIWFYCESWHRRNTKNTRVLDKCVVRR